jgi:hypothetical protein
MFADAFRDQPDVMARFLDNCRATGIPLPTDGDPTEVPSTPVNQRGAALRLQQAPRFLSPMGKQAFGSSDPGPIGPSIDHCGRLTIHACCPSEWRKAGHR